MCDLIEKLSNLRSQYNCFDENKRDAYHTLSEAIKVLSERPEPCEDAVSRQAAYDALMAEPLKWDDSSVWESARCYQWMMDMDAIKALPSAQPDIVRCKDCLMHGSCRFEQGLGLDGYCSQAERRADGGHNQQTGGD